MLWNVFNRYFLLVLLLARTIYANDLDRRIDGLRQDVPIVEKGVLGQTDVDEGRFEAWVEIFDPSFEYASYDALGTATAFDIKFVQDAIN